jgi:hypothetical protein
MRTRGARALQAGADRYSEFAATSRAIRWNKCLFEPRHGVGKLLLKVAHLETGCGWVPFCSSRMDDTGASAAWRRQDYQREAEFLLQAPVLVSCEAGEELAPTFVEHIGDDHLTIATDYLHSDCIGKFPDLTGALSANTKLSSESRDPVDNPVKLGRAR